jgi:steroid delta-isomerase
MKTLMIGLVVGQLLSTAAFGATMSDEAAIRGRLTAWTTAFNQRQGDQVCDLFADDVISMVRGAPNGDKASICKQLRDALGRPDPKLSYANDIQEVLVSGDLAVVRLTWTLTSESAGKTEVSTEKGMDVFRRGPDGVWRIARFIAFTTGKDD